MFHKTRLFEELESRQLCTVTVTPVAPDTLYLNGDGANDTAYIYDNGSGVISGWASNAAGTLSPFGAFAGIRHIYGNMNGGDDTVIYKMYGSNIMGGATFVSMKLGDGNDTFMFYAANQIYLGPNAYVDVRAFGDSGKDSLSAYYNGKLEGRLNVIFDGGDGDDTLHTEANLDFGSTGGFYAASYGQAGNDNIDMLVRKANPADPAWVSAFASGGGDFDQVHRTALAFNDATCEWVWVVP